MPLIFDSTSVPANMVEELHRSLREDLLATQELVTQPTGTVRDPASLETARDLLQSTLAVLDGPGPRSPEARVAEVNLAYATMVTVIDLVKSHTDVPRVPQKRPPS